MTPAWPHGDPRDVIRAIEADPRFVRAPPPDIVGRTWLDVLHDWFVGLLRAIFHRLDRVLGAHNGFEVAIGIGLVLAAAALIVVCSVAAVRLWRPSRPGRTGGRSRTDAASAAGHDAATLRRAAAEAARAARYRAAAGLLFAAAVVALDERGQVAFDPARTPGEYRRLVGEPSFDALAREAIVALFAPAEPPRELFERMSAAYDRFFGSGAP